MRNTSLLNIKHMSAGMLLSCSFLLVAPHALASNTPSDLDVSLAGSGSTLLEYRHSGLEPDIFRDWNHPAFATYVNNNGSFTIVGATDIACDNCGDFTTERKMVIVRFAADGSYIGEGVTDSSFLTAAAFSHDGNKVIGAGEVSFNNRVLRKFNLDGSLDTSFADGGSYADVDQRLPTVPAIFIDRENRILVSFHREKGLSRFLPDGTLDTSFGVDGSTGAGTLNYASYENPGADIVQSDDGHYYALTKGVSGSPYILKYDESGQIVTTFGNSGILEMQEEHVHRIVALPDNGVATITSNYQGQQAKVLRYNSDGELEAESPVIAQNSSDTGYIQLGVGQGGQIYQVNDEHLLTAITWLGRTASWQMTTRTLFAMWNIDDLTPVLSFDDGVDDNNNGIRVHDVFGFDSSNPLTSQQLTQDAQGRFVLIGHTGANGQDNIQDGVASWAVVRLLGDSDGEPVVDTTPDAFEFEPALDMALSSTVTSNAVTILGIEAATLVSITGGEYSIGCGGSFTNAEGSINNEQTICVRHTSANDWDTETTTTLNVGGVTADFTSRTMFDPDYEPDTTPEPFNFEPQSDVPVLERIVSNTVTITGIDAPASISVSNGDYSIGCSDELTNVAGEIENQQTVCVSHVSAFGCLAETTTVLTVGGVQASFTSTTLDDSLDSDGDGISDCIDTSPYDAAEASLNLGGGNTMDIATDNGEFRDIELIDPEETSNQEGRPENYDFPYDLVSYEVVNLNPGDSITVNLEYPANLPAGTRIFKYSDDAGYVEFESAVINGSQVTLTLTDGGEGDADGIENGTIVDPVGPAALSDSGDGGDGGSNNERTPEKRNKAFLGSTSLWLLLGFTLLARRRFLTKRS